MSAQDDLAELYETKSNLLVSIKNASKNAEIASYNFSDADGSQAATRRDLKSLMDTLQLVSDQIEELEAKLRRGSGIRIIETRRI
jgi:hypothetical protein